MKSLIQTIGILDMNEDSHNHITLQCKPSAVGDKSIDSTSEYKGISHANIISIPRASLYVARFLKIVMENWLLSKKLSDKSLD